MDKIIEKISSYNLFNYLLPGILFVIILEELNIYSLIQNDLIIAPFLYYFIGLVISRFGSLIVEPTLKKVKFLKFINYKNFVLASKKDSKIDVLSEENNMYRTFTSMFVLLLLLKIYTLAENQFPILKAWNLLIVTILLLILFLYSYKKQSDYIAKRVKVIQK